VVTRESALGSIAGKAAEFGGVLADGICGLNFSFLCASGIYPGRHFRQGLRLVLCCFGLIETFREDGLLGSGCPRDLPGKQCK
jgi:hypothetical protein